MGKRKKMISAIIIEPGKDPRMETIHNELHTLQRLVDGYIEVCPLAEDMVMIINEEGKLRHLPQNFWMKVVGDYIVGTAVFVGVDGDEFDNVPVTLSALYSVMPELWRK